MRNAENISYCTLEMTTNVRIGNSGVHRKKGMAANLRTGNSVLEQVSQFCYLGRIITRNNKSLTEVKRTA